MKRSTSFLPYANSQLHPTHYFPAVTSLPQVIYQPILFHDEVTCSGSQSHRSALSSTSQRYRTQPLLTSRSHNDENCLRTSPCHSPRQPQNFCGSPDMNFLSLEGRPYFDCCYKCCTMYPGHDMVDNIDEDMLEIPVKTTRKRHRSRKRRPRNEKGVIIESGFNQTGNTDQYVMTSGPFETEKSETFESPRRSSEASLTATPSEKWSMLMKQIVRQDVVLE